MIVITLKEELKTEFASQTYNLSEKRVDVLEGVMNNDPDEAIAGELSITKYQVGKHIKALREKFNTRSKPSLIAHIFNQFSDGMSVKRGTEELNIAESYYANAIDNKRRVIDCLMQTGGNDQVIGHITGIPSNTVSVLVTEIFDFLGVHSRSDAVIALNAMRINCPHLFNTTTPV